MLKKLKLTYLLSFAAILFAIALPTLAHGETLSTGWYPSLAPVDSASSDFRFAIEFMKAKTGLGEPALVAEKFANTDALAPHVLRFPCKNAGGSTATVDAVLSFYHPEVSVIDIERACGLPLTNPGPYAKPAPPAPVVVAAKPAVLVGPAIDGTDGWYQPVAGDDSPDGSVYSDSRGVFIKVVRLTPFGKSQYWKVVRF